MKHLAKHRTDERGMATGAAMALCTLVMLTVMTMANLSISAMRLTQNGRDKAISLSLAEAGVDDGVDQLRLNNNYGGTGSTEVQLHDADGKLLGTYKTSMVKVNQNLVDVYSTGTTINQKPRQVRARVAISGLTVGDGAMISNGDINVDGKVAVNTDPLGQRSAHLRANGNIYVKGIDAKIDGRVAAAGTVTMGLGVSTDTLFPNGQSGAARIPFPSTKTKKLWEEQWISAANLGTYYASGISGTAEIQAPAFINGNIQLNGGHTLTIKGSGVVYINGHIMMSGESKLVNTAQLVLKGKLEQKGETLTTGVAKPIYQADGTWSFTPPVLIALSNEAAAVTLTGGAGSNQYSMIYAVNGGIKVDGASEVRGALVAGGKGATIVSSGDYVHTYPINAVMSSKIGNAPAVISWIEM